MQTIIQIAAWVVLAVGFFAVGLKFFPNLKKWLITGKVSYVWLIAITFGLFVMLTYPYFFNWWAINFWGVTEGELSDLGPLGDIYGSLNSLISSIALCAVAYSAWLQVTSLKETRLVNNLQIRESRNAIFTTKFYSLLSYKEEILRSLNITFEGKTYQGREIFSIYVIYIDNLFDNEWKDLNHFDKKLLNAEIRKCNKIVNDGKEFSDWYSYFLQTVNLINLIKNSNIDSDEKKYFYNILRSSMSMHEQLTLFWVAPATPQVYDFLRGIRIFNLFFNRKLIPFAKHFYDESCFNNKSWGDVFNKTPT